MWLWLGVALAAFLLVLNGFLVWRRIAQLRAARAEEHDPGEDEAPARPPAAPRRDARRSPRAGGAAHPETGWGATVSADGAVRRLQREGGASAEAELTLARDVVLVSGCARSDKGLKRVANEDAVLMGRHNVFAVADGMGGHAAGEIASRVALAALAKAYEGGEPDASGIADLPARGASLVRAIWDANDALRHERTVTGLDMGTTLVAIRFATKKHTAYVANVGDSRCYRIRDGQAERLTRDHTTRNEQGRERLSRALGMVDRPEVDLHVIDTRPEDVFLLCTDGLWTHVPDLRMAAIVRRHRDLEDAARKLVADAVAAGSRDDVSVALVHVRDADEA